MEGGIASKRDKAIRKVCSARETLNGRLRFVDSNTQGTYHLARGRSKGRINFKLGFCQVYELWNISPMLRARGYSLLERSHLVELGIHDVNSASTEAKMSELPDTSLNVPS